MKIVALIAARNEAAYLWRCFEHLHTNGIEFCLIDNESTDATVDIARRFEGRGLLGIVTARYPGFFDLTAQLKIKAQLASEFGADWYIHQDADEILEAPDSRTTLHDAIATVDAAGDNVINFDEFVFPPTSEDENCEGRDYVELMSRYYFFEPHPVRLMRAWRAASEVNFASSGGHHVLFSDRRIHPISFVLRHYIAPSMGYLRRKYLSRTYSERETKQLGWHGWRAAFSDWVVAPPAAEHLKTYGGPGTWDRSDPKKDHQFLVRLP
jgi:glycosyltransferase involved in cell wall biosynthesis